MKNEELCKDPYHPISTEEGCKKAAIGLSFSAVNISSAAYSSNNESQDMNLKHCYQYNNQIYFSEMPEGTAADKYKAVCNPGNFYIST